MPIYRTATKPVTETLNGKERTVVHVAWTSSAGAASKERSRLAEAHGLKRNDVEVTEADIPKMGKGGVIAYLNAFHTQVPADYVPDGYPKAAGSKTKAKKKK